MTYFSIPITMHEMLCMDIQHLTLQAEEAHGQVDQGQRQS